MRRGLPPARGRFTLRRHRTPTSRTRWSPPGATPRSWSASATARTSSPATSPRSSRTPATRSSSGQDQVVEIDRARGVTVTDFAGAAVEPTDYNVDWDAAAAEKGGYDYFMLKEIAEQPQAVADTLLGRLGEHGELVLDEVRLSDQDLRDIDKVFIVACGTALPRRPDRQVRDRALDPHPGRGRAGQRVPLPRPGARPLHAGHRDQPVRRDHGHADGAAARQGAEGPGPGHLQHQRLDHPARVRRRALHPRRARRSRSPRPRRSSPSSSPATWSGCTSPRCAA